MLCQTKESIRLKNRTRLFDSPRLLLSPTFYFNGLKLYCFQFCQKRNGVLSIDVYASMMMMVVGRNAILCCMAYPDAGCFYSTFKYAGHDRRQWAVGYWHSFPESINTAFKLHCKICRANKKEIGTRANSATGTFAFKLDQHTDI